MPIIHVTLVDGRPPEQVERFAAAITEAAVTALHAPRDSIRVVVNIVSPQHYFIAGRRYDRRSADPDGHASGGADQ